MKKLFAITVVGAILVPLVARLLLAAEPGQADRPDVQRITLAQIRVGRDVDDNLARIRAAFAQAKKDKAKWIMFPEGALSGYGNKFDQAKVAAALTEIMALCRDARIIAVLGTCWKENGQTTNEILIIDADGKVVGRYVKRCLTYGEAKHFKVGDTPLVHPVNDLKVGTLICNDLWVTPGFSDGPNPHLTLQQARAGAQVIFLAVNSGSNAKFREYHESNLKVRSAEAKCPIVIVNAAADEPINCASGVVVDFEYVKALPTKGEVVETVTFQPRGSRADEPRVVELWPGKAPEEPGTIGAEKAFPSTPKKERSETTEMTRLITNVTKPTITIFRPVKEKDTGAAMLICPGGGYHNLWWQLEGEEVAAWLNSIGVTGILLKYRVPRRPDDVKGEAPARRPLQDAQRAVSLVRTKAKKWGLDPKRIGIVGFSAGGHLAIATATSFEKRTYEPIDDIDKVSCRPDFAVPVYSGYLKSEVKDELAAGLRVPADTPPVFLAHGGADPVSPPEHSVTMYLALRRAGVPAELHVYSDSLHGFGVRPVNKTCGTWTRSCADWMRHQGFLKANAER